MAKKNRKPAIIHIASQPIAEEGFGDTNATCQVVGESDELIALLISVMRAEPSVGHIFNEAIAGFTAMAIDGNFTQQVSQKGSIREISVDTQAN